MLNIDNLPKFTYRNGSELAAKLCYFRKQSKNRLFLTTRNIHCSTGTKQIKRIFIFVGVVYDSIRKYGIYRRHYDVGVWAPSRKDQKPGPIQINKAARILNKFISVKFVDKFKTITIYGRYAFTKPLLLIWKKGNLIGFPKDLIRYISEYLT